MSSSENIIVNVINKPDYIQYIISIAAAMFSAFLGGWATNKYNIGNLRRKELINFRNSLSDLTAKSTKNSIEEMIENMTILKMSSKQIAKISSEIDDLEKTISEKTMIAAKLESSISLYLKM